MFVASYSRTMASAKPKAVVPSDVVVKTITRRDREEQQQRRAASMRLEAARQAVANRERELARAKEILANAARLGARNTYARIEALAMVLFNVSRRELNGSRRHRQICFARQFVMYWCCRLTTLSLPQIGRKMGGRDHTTVLHGKQAYVQKRAKMGRFLREVR